MGLLGFGKSESDKEQEYNTKERHKEREFTKQQNIVTDSISRDDETYFHSEDKKSDLLRWQQEFMEEKRKFILQLRGYVDEGDGKLRKHADSMPLCNERFVAVVSTWMDGFLSKHMVNTKLDERRALDLLRRNSNDLADMMSDHYYEYGIKFYDFDTVLRLCKNVMTVNVHKAIEGWTKKMDNTMNKQITTLQQQTIDGDGKKGKIFG